MPLWIGGASAAARRRAAAVGDGWMPLFLTVDDYGPALGGAARGRQSRPGAHPDAVEPGVVVFVHVGDDDDQTGADRGGRSGCPRLYGLPPRAFDRHLVAGPADVCAAQLDRFVEAGARHVMVMVAGTGALEHFSLAAAFAATTARPVDGAVPVGVTG